jgi:hypothetical protein
MSTYTKTQLKALYGLTGTQFPDNTTGDITEIIMRTFGENGVDSFFNLLDDAYSGAKATRSNITTITELKAIPTVSGSAAPQLTILSFIDADDSYILKTYCLVSGASAEALPTIVRPDDFDGTKVWSLCSIGVLTYPKFRGAWDASGNIYPEEPTTTGSNADGSIAAGDEWKITVAGTLDGGLWPVKTIVKALVDNPGQTDANWRLI